MAMADCIRTVVTTGEIVGGGLDGPMIKDEIPAFEVLAFIFHAHC
jgi:hypothetical protein